MTLKQIQNDKEKHTQHPISDSLAFTIDLELKDSEQNLFISREQTVFINLKWYQPTVSHFENNSKYSHKTSFMYISIAVIIALSNLDVYVNPQTHFYVTFVSIPI